MPDRKETLIGIVNQYLNDNDDVINEIEKVVGWAMADEELKDAEAGEILDKCEDAMDFFERLQVFLEDYLNEVNNGVQ